MYLAIDQYNNKTIIKDCKIKTLLEKFGYNSAKPMYRDFNGKSQKVGYVLTCKSESALWIELFELNRAF